jgi:hypothetical protein
MSRVRLIAAAAFAIAGIVLAGCSSTSVPSWLQTTPPPPPTQALQFQSVPPGVDVRTVDGQTCKTPCALALPLTTQSISFAMTGYLPQTVPVQVQQSDPPTFAPNPVVATLQSAEPKPKPKPHKPKTAKTVAKSAAPKSAAPAQDSVFPPPPPPAASSPYPDAPQPMQPATPSPFPPPPSQRQ